MTLQAGSMNNTHESNGWMNRITTILNPSEQQNLLASRRKDKLECIMCFLATEAIMQLPRLHTCRLCQSSNQTAMTSSAQSVTTDFATHGESHFYGLPCPSADSLDPMDHFCTFDVSKIIPKNMQNCHTRLLNPFLRIYVGLTPKTAYIGMCAKGQKYFVVFLDVDPTHLSPGLPYALRSLGFDLSLPIWRSI